MKIYDVSVTLGAETPIYEGDPKIEIIPHSSIKSGDSANVTLLSMGAHSGTHIDAPFHFSESGKHIDELSTDLFVGPAQVIEVADVDGLVTREEIASKVNDGTTRLLLKTGNSSSLWGRTDFEKGFVSLSKGAADLIVESGIRLVGIDYLSIERFHSPDHAVHRTLLENSVAIIEGLDLSAVPEGEYKLICLPLKIKNGDGSPARAILIDE